MTIQNLVELYTLETLAARLNRSEVGVRTRLRASGRIPKGRRNGQPGGYLVWDVDVIEDAIAADPGLVLPAKAKEDGAMMPGKSATAALATILADHLSQSPAKAATICELIEVGKRAGMPQAETRARVTMMTLAGSVTCLPIAGEILVQLVGGEV